MAPMHSFEEVLRMACRHVQEQLGRLVVAEWGPGESTRIMLEEGATVYSVEHQKKWYDQAVELYPKATIELVRRFRDADEGYVTHHWCHFLEREYTMAFIDGRSRVDCTRLSEAMLPVGGVIVVHDAERYGRQLAFDVVIEQTGVIYIQ